MIPSQGEAKLGATLAQGLFVDLSLVVEWD